MSLAQAEASAAEQKLADTRAQRQRLAQDTRALQDRVSELAEDRYCAAQDGVAFTLSDATDIIYSFIRSPIYTVRRSNGRRGCCRPRRSV